jgi:hypothetical protein
MPPPLLKPVRKKLIERSAYLHIRIDQERYAQLRDTYGNTDSQEHSIIVVKPSKGTNPNILYRAGSTELTCAWNVL